MQKSVKGPRPLRKLKTLLGKIGTLNLILMIVGAFFVWFNWQMLSIFREQGAIPETYACAVIAATLGECGICGWIRTTKENLREQARKGCTGLSESENAMHGLQNGEDSQNESEVENYE